MRLGLLGHPELLRDTAQSVRFRVAEPVIEAGSAVRLQPLALALLAYLHVEGPQERDHLAQLFWPNSAGGLNALSTTLSRVRSEAPDAVWAKGRDLLGCDLASDYLDLTEAATSGDVGMLEQLSGRAFLQTLNLRRFGLEFEEWLLGVRSSLDARTEAALMRCAVMRRDHGDLVGAADLAESAFVVAERRGVPSIDLLPTYFEILAGAGRGLVIDVRATAEEFGIALPDAGSAGSPPRVAVDPLDHDAEALDSVSPAASAPPEQQRQNPFVGCDEELRSLAQSTVDHAVTSIVGLGGAGKSRLLAEFGGSDEVAERFAQTTWVDLAGVEETSLMGAAVADALGKPIRPGQPLASLFDPTASSLLLIDNSEAVAGITDELSELTQACPALRVVLARRIPLGVSGEPIVAMTGLDTDLVQGSSPARELFSAAARRARGEGLGVDEEAEVDRVCRLVGGLPLALELAGAWVGLLRVSSLAEALESDIEVLDGSLHAQNRSMESVLEFAWSSLDPQEQRAVMALSVFAGGAPIDALTSMRRVNLRTLGGLVRKAVVTVSADDRFDVHALVRSIALRHLTEDVELAAEFREAHAQWCVERVRALGAELDGSNQAEAMRSLADEMQNIWLVWDAAAEQKRVDVASVLLQPLREFLFKSARFTRAENVFEVGLASFGADRQLVGADDDGPGLHPEVRLRAELTDALALFSLVTGRAGRAAELSTRALQEAPDDGPVTASILRTQAMIAFGQSDMAAAESKVTEALALLEPHESPRLSAKLHEDLGHCHRFRGEVELARQAYRSALDNGRLLGDPHMVARSCLTLGELERSEAPQRSRVLLDQGFEIVRENQLDHLGTYFPGALGKTYLELAEYETARDCFLEGVELASEAGVVITVAASHFGLAQAYHHLGDPVLARQHVELGLRRSVDGDCWPYLLEGLATIALLSVDSPPVPDAVVELLRIALHHPATEPEARTLAQTLAAQLTISDDVPSRLDAIRLDELAEDAIGVLATPARTAARG